MRNINEYAKRGQNYISDSHFDLGEFYPVIERAKDIGVLDALFAAYFAGVALGYEEGKEETAQRLENKEALERIAKTGVPF